MTKLVADVHSQRSIPKFASRTFKSWFFARRQPANGKRVILWPDTFNNYFHPATAIAAVEVLERAGFRVEVPRADVCCGRPLYDWGMLDRAKALLQTTLHTLRPPIESGVPIVILEPSCATVFREELTNFFPADKAAKKLTEQ